MLIPQWGVNRVWFSAGAIIGGLLMGFLLAENQATNIHPVTAIIAGLVSAAAFLISFDKNGDLKIVYAIPAIAIAGIVAISLKVPVLGGVLGLLFYLIVGYLAVLVRYFLIGLKQLGLSIISVGRRRQ